MRTYLNRARFTTTDEDKIKLFMCNLGSVYFPKKIYNTHHIEFSDTYMHEALNALEKITNYTV